MNAQYPTRDRRTRRRHGITARMREIDRRANDAAHRIDIAII